ncbi:MAG TPA: DUF6776 family protein [Luteimonas sp.]|nr:DUF6776 family protein [Luteimonas sp.]
MTDDAVPPAPVDAPPETEAAPMPAEARRLLYGVLLVLAVSLAFGAWGLWKTLVEGGGDGQATSQAARAKLDELEQRVATLTRSDQISRDANRDLQGTLAERDEEIAGLRADVAFYERFVGATSQRRGLTVHALQVQPQGGGAWHFTTTLTQNLNRGATSSGRLTLSVEGTRGGALERLSWADLRRQARNPGVEYSFKYFQQIEGDLLLPADFQPLRVRVRAVPTGGTPVEQAFPWAEAAARPAPGA